MADLHTGFISKLHRLPWPRGAGTDIFRLNCSQRSGGEFGRIFPLMRKAANELGKKAPGRKHALLWSYIFCIAAESEIAWVGGCVCVCLEVKCLRDLQCSKCCVGELAGAPIQLNNSDVLESDVSQDDHHYMRAGHILSAATKLGIDVLLENDIMKVKEKLSNIVERKVKLIPGNKFKACKGVNVPDVETNFTNGIEEGTCISPPCFFCILEDLTVAQIDQDQPRHLLSQMDWRAFVEVPAQQSYFALLMHSYWLCLCVRESEMTRQMHVCANLQRSNPGRTNGSLESRGLAFRLCLSQEAYGFRVQVLRFRARNSARGCMQFMHCLQVERSGSSDSSNPAK